MSLPASSITVSVETFADLTEVKLPTPLSKATSTHRHLYEVAVPAATERRVAAEKNLNEVKKQSLARDIQRLYDQAADGSAADFSFGPDPVAEAEQILKIAEPDERVAKRTLKAAAEFVTVRLRDPKARVRKALESGWAKVHHRSDPATTSAADMAAPLDAACAQRRDIDWFSTDPLEVTKARLVCSTCPVRSECGAYAAFTCQHSTGRQGANRQVKSNSTLHDDTGV